MLDVPVMVHRWETRTSVAIFPRMSSKRDMPKMEKTFVGDSLESRWVSFVDVLCGISQFHVEARLFYPDFITQFAVVSLFQFCFL